jgi:hypothetical protein
MRTILVVAYLLATLLSSCTTSFKGLPVRYGGYARVSKDDVRAATKAVEQFLPKDTVHGYRVISSTEIHVCETADEISNYRTARKSNGKWHESRRCYGLDGAIGTVKGQRCSYRPCRYGFTLSA